MIARFEAGRFDSSAFGGCEFRPADRSGGGEKESHAGGEFAEYDRVAMCDVPSINGDNETAGPQAGERRPQAALEGIVGGARTDDLSNDQRHQLGNPNGGSEREGAAAAAQHGVEIERHLNADHVGSDFP